MIGAHDARTFRKPQPQLEIDSRGTGVTDLDAPDILDFDGAQSHPRHQGQKLRVRGKGLPKGNNGERGDLYVVINVQLPKQVTPEERELWEKLARRFKLIGVQGIVRMAMSGFDVACWDALAVAAGKPLVTLLGGAPRRIRAYNSNGLGLMAPGAVADEAERLLEGGFRAVKLRLGHPTLAADLAAVRAARKRLPDSVELMVDFNQALSLAEALERGRAIDSEGIAWIEEPIRHDDFRGCAELARELRTPVQIGENFSLPEQMAEALAAKACDLVMPDLERIGGVTGWQRAASLAAERKLPMSSHLFPETSAHLLAVTPTCHYLEYVDWAAAILAEPLRIEDGAAVIPDRPGTGVAWDEEAVKRYEMA